MAVDGLAQRPRPHGREPHRHEPRGLEPRRHRQCQPVARPSCCERGELGLEDLVGVDADGREVPGAPAEAVGRKVNFTGTDTLRVADGMLAEYWANADSLLFFQQLGVSAVPAG
jgi:hypothetical protein